MGGGGERLQAVLEGYDRFLVEKDLSSQKERPYLVPKQANSPEQRSNCLVA